jgi:hypothetical protein
MNETWRALVLNRLLLQTRCGPALGSSLQSDKWIASSALQKSIRRGHAELALAAAARFRELDPAGVWRRLISIAFEDVGAAEPDALIDTVAIATAADWRAKHGEAQALAWIVQRLADAPKDRSADLLMLAVRHHPTLAPRRALCSQAPLDRRLQLVGTRSASFADRAVAAWFSSGLDFRYERVVGSGSLQGLAEVYRTLGVGPELTEATVLAARRTREPFTVLVPLVRLEIERSGGGMVRRQALPDSPIVDGLLLCGIDEHTRPGSRPSTGWFPRTAGCALALSGSSPSLDGPQPPSTQPSMWMAPLSPSGWTGRAREPLRPSASRADLGSAQVPPEGVQPLLDAVGGPRPAQRDPPRYLVRSPCCRPASAGIAVIRTMSMRPNLR